MLVLFVMLGLFFIAYDRCESRAMWERVEAHRASLGLDPIDPRLRKKRGLPPL